MLKLAIAGAAGRMGRALIQTISQTADAQLAAAIEHTTSPTLGQDAGLLAGGSVLGISVGTELPSSDGAFDVLLEFTTPKATLARVDSCVRLGRSMVIGTTGIQADGEEYIRRAAQNIPIVLASNTSVGVNICLALLPIAAAALGEDFDIEIIETHHRGKVDAPSGTALSLGRAVAEPLGRDIAVDGVFSRHGQVGARKSGEIGFSTIRGGDIAGEHRVLFIGNGEQVEITHRASDRQIFAVGAIRAAKWLANQPPGLYSMHHVLGLIRPKV